MPPLLAALLMIELSCDLRIVQAVDLNMQWRLYKMNPLYVHPWDCWYAGWLGVSESNQPWHIYRGTYAWPRPFRTKRYAPQ